MSPKSPRFFAPNRTVVIGAGVVFLVLFGYTLSVAFPFLAGPSLVLESPNGRVIQGVTDVRGATKRVAFLSINGEPVALGEDGSFSVQRAYPSGYTALTIEAKDRFGRVRVERISFITNN